MAKKPKIPKLGAQPGTKQVLVPPPPKMKPAHKKGGGYVG